jgi:hypothetical protein
MVPESELPGDFVHAVRGIKMDGPCAKVNRVLSEETLFTCTPRHSDPQQRSLFTLVPSSSLRSCYDIAKLVKFGAVVGRLRDRFNANPSLAPEGKHVMTCFAQYVPYCCGKDWG